MKRLYFLFVIVALILSGIVYMPSSSEAMEGVELKDAELEMAASYEELILCSQVSLSGGKIASLPDAKNIILKNVKNGVWRPAGIASSDGSNSGSANNEGPIGFAQIGGEKDRDSIYRPSDGIVNVSGTRIWPQPIARNQMILVRAESSGDWIPVAANTIAPLQPKSSQDALVCEVSISEIRERFRDDRDSSFGPIPPPEGGVPRLGKHKGPPSKFVIPFPIVRLTDPTNKSKGGGWAPGLDRSVGSALGSSLFGASSLTDSSNNPIRHFRRGSSSGALPKMPKTPFWIIRSRGTKGF